MQATAEREFPLFLIWFKKSVRFIRVGRLLHLVSLLGGMLFWVCGQYTLNLFQLENWWATVCWGYLSIYGIILIWFAQKDAICRYQNYKMAKDLFYEKQARELSRKRVASLFGISKCQREAAMVAARDIGIDLEIGRHYRDMGYRWYHLIPDRVVQSPTILFTRSYWKKTLFVPYYQSRYFLW